MSAEVLFWWGVIFSSPAFFMLGKRVVGLVFDMLDSSVSKEVVIDFKVGDRRKQKRVRLDDPDELIQVLTEVRDAEERRLKERKR